MFISAVADRYSRGGGGIYEDAMKNVHGGSGLHDFLDKLCGSYMQTATRVPQEKTQEMFND